MSGRGPGAGGGPAAGRSAAPGGAGDAGAGRAPGAPPPPPPQQPQQPPGASSMDEMRRRAGKKYLDDLKDRERGLSPRHIKVLEGVFAMLPRPDAVALGRLGLQLDVDAAAVRAWFVNRRAQQRRSRRLTAAALLFGAAFLAAAALLLWRFVNWDALKEAAGQVRRKAAERARTSGVMPPPGTPGT